MNDITTFPHASRNDLPIRVLALPGSLRRDSFNRLLCVEAARLAPAAVAVEVFEDMASIPPFDEDVEATSPGGPEGVRQLREAVARADGLLIATPEYNQSVPGVLKNTIDWLSRPSPDEVLAGKPVAVIGASTGPWGTRLAQKELRHVLAATGSPAMVEPMLFVRHAAALFGADGNLVDKATQMKLAAVLTAFATWIERVNGRMAYDGQPRQTA